MGHPHDPVSHSHHNSIWVSHNDVNGWSFWADRGTNQGRIVGQRLEKLEDSDAGAAATIFSHWLDKTGKVLLEERRRVSLELLPDGESLLVLDLRFEAKGAPVTFGKTPFGLVGVRLAKTIGIADGGGTIRNSEGNVDEQGDNGCFWKRARWCDYSGPVLPGKAEGATLFDHPANPKASWHARGYGLVGANPFGRNHSGFPSQKGKEDLIKIAKGGELKLKYAVYAHTGDVKSGKVAEAYEAFKR